MPHKVHCFCDLMLVVHLVSFFKHLTHQIFADPKRHGEFARASAAINLQGSKRVYYCGIMGDKLNELQSTIQSQVYKKWDDSSEAPAKTRPRETEAKAREISLDVLAWNARANKPTWPDVILAKFNEGPELAALKEMKAQFEMEFGKVESVPASTLGSSRVAGSCDFAFDGSSPLDPERIIELAVVPMAEVPSERPPVGQNCLVQIQKNIIIEIPIKIPRILGQFC